MNLKTTVPIFTHIASLVGVYHLQLFSIMPSFMVLYDIMEYGSTPYIGMARKKMAAPYDAYKIIRSELGSDYSHRLL